MRPSILDLFADARPKKKLTCSLCKRLQPEDNFSKNKNKTNGHSSQCNRCKSEAFHLREKKDERRTTTKSSEAHS
jgi:hypothetical protein